MKEKILLIIGCSHAAGSEIDGNEDSAYNRENSFGNLLAKKLGRTPINIASNSASNQAISRTVLEWFDKNYQPDIMDLSVLVAWTESCRLDVPLSRVTWHEQWNPFSEFISETARNYIRVNMGYKGADPEEKYVIAKFQEFMAEFPLFIEILSANLILQLQYFFNSHNLPYIMCNTMHMFSQDHRIDFYCSQIDQTSFFNLIDNEQCFYWKYKNLGYSNKKAQYWHHDEIPHRLYADELYNFYIKKYIK